MSAPAIAARGVVKRYGDAVALAGVDLRVERGEIVGLVGPNGAGKTTLLRILSGFLDPDEGAVDIAGYALASARRAAQAALGYLPEAVPLYRDMRVAAHLEFAAKLAGVDRDMMDERVAEALRACELEDQRQRLVGQLSKGYRQRVGLACALVADPAVLILDEPSAGLDPVQTRGLRALLDAQRARRGVLIASHDLGDIEAVSDRVVVLVGGRVVGDDTAAGLRERLGLAADSSLDEVFLVLSGAAAEAAPGAARDGGA
ncbi:ABC transporter ATP-binding protein [Haliangium ochraceum]|uniref:ABC transporter related protein n=1 Tax=Haliangium ochraceum (strain DSM 14365 / JCM 11303 / SMP-2) TaxID=502025 RepID=D0LGA9_HALO1|nr:ABC transporter ATP-binding protein [Haliangium ochraceum]ACY18134.1 ABC transporter related protein [Haliangium ochraceum DSM 14365]